MRKHAYWIHYQRPDILVCSNCDEGFGVELEKKLKYCAYCGAKMDLKDPYEQTLYRPDGTTYTGEKSQLIEAEYPEECDFYVFDGQKFELVRYSAICMLFRTEKYRFWAFGTVMQVSHFLTQAPFRMHIKKMIFLELKSNVNDNTGAQYFANKILYTACIIFKTNSNE